MAGNTLASFGNVMTNGLLILLTVFILSEEVMFTRKLKHATPGGAKTMLAFERFTHSANKYMAIKTGISFVTGVYFGLMLKVVGVDYILWGLLAC